MSVNQKFFKVTTTTKTYKVKAVESCEGLFCSRMIWRLYSASYTALFPTYTHLCNCEDVNRLGEAIRIAIPNCKKIEVINH